MKVKRKIEDSENDDGLEIKHKVPKIHNEKTDTDKVESEYVDNEKTYTDNVDSDRDKTDTINVDSEHVDCEKTVTDKVDSEKNHHEKYQCKICNDDHDEGSCSHWKYPSTNWPDICPGYCSGQSQSPIDIVTSPLPTDNSLFRFHDYGVPVNTVNLNNNGHSATISWDNSVNSLSISGGGLDGNYTLAQFHFHWGCENSQGSEHTVDGHSYPMELHLVHYKTAYGSLGEAIKHSDGLAVLGIFIEVGAENLALKPITDNLYQITEAGVDVDIHYNEKIEDVLPTSSDSFYRYLGSLTTPTCNEVVIWSVIKNTIEISQAQLDAFRSIKDHEGHSICDNFRYVQPLNGRTVTKFN